MHCLVNPNLLHNRTRLPGFHSLFRIAQRLLSSVELRMSGNSQLVRWLVFVLCATIIAQANSMGGECEHMPSICKSFCMLHVLSGRSDQTGSDTEASNSGSTGQSNSGSTGQSNSGSTGQSNSGSTGQSNSDSTGQSNSGSQSVSGSTGQSNSGSQSVSGSTGQSNSGSTGQSGTSNGE